MDHGRSRSARSRAKHEDVRDMARLTSSPEGSATSAELSGPLPPAKGRKGKGKKAEGQWPRYTGKYTKVKAQGQGQTATAQQQAHTGKGTKAKTNGRGDSLKQRAQTKSELGLAL